MSSFGYIVDYDIRPAAKPAFFFVSWPAALAIAALEFSARRSRTSPYYSRHLHRDIQAVVADGVDVIIDPVGDGPDSPQG